MSISERWSTPTVVVASIASATGVLFVSLAVVQAQFRTVPPFTLPANTNAQGLPPTIRCGTVVHPAASCPAFQNRVGSVMWLALVGFIAVAIAVGAWVHGRWRSGARTVFVTVALLICAGIVVFFLYSWARDRTSPSEESFTPTYRLELHGRGSELR